MGAVMTEEERDDLLRAVQADLTVVKDKVSGLAGEQNRHAEEIFGSTLKGTRGLKPRLDEIDRMVTQVKAMVAGAAAIVTLNGGLLLVNIWRT